MIQLLLTSLVVLFAGQTQLPEPQATPASAALATSDDPPFPYGSLTGRYTLDGNDNVAVNIASDPTNLCGLGIPSVKGQPLWGEAFEFCYIGGGVYAFTNNDGNSGTITPTGPDSFDTQMTTGPNAGKPAKSWTRA